MIQRYFFFYLNNSKNNVIFLYDTLWRFQAAENLNRLTQKVAVDISLY